MGDSRARHNRMSPARPTAWYVLLVALVFQGLSGIAGGIGFLVDPSGATLGIPLEWLEGSPFANYLIPGLVLLIVLGVLPLIVVTGVWRRSRWGRISAVAVGAALLIWLAVEILVVGYQPEPPFQAVYAALGVAIMVAASAPSVRSLFNTPMQPA